MRRPTAQEGLWFTAGSLAQCRIHPKCLALRIKAREAGMSARCRARTARDVRTPS
ncbi:MAG: hypothetical protein ICV73_20795 [Acetobacteraceae bacterium]|nr:hypothetical protein [Acetobacteraceae bacterium]